MIFPSLPCFQFLFLLDSFKHKNNPESPILRVAFLPLCYSSYPFPSSYYNHLSWVLTLSRSSFYGSCSLLLLVLQLNPHKPIPTNWQIQTSSYLTYPYQMTLLTTASVLRLSCLLNIWDHNLLWSLFSATSSQCSSFPVHLLLLHSRLSPHSHSVDAPLLTCSSSHTLCLDCLSLGKPSSPWLRSNTLKPGCPFACMSFNCWGPDSTPAYP